MRYAGPKKQFYMLLYAKIMDVHILLLDVIMLVLAIIMVHMKPNNLFLNLKMN